VPSGSFSGLTPGAIPVCAGRGIAPNEVVVKKHNTGITNLKVALAIFTILPFSAQQQQSKVMSKRLAGPRNATLPAQVEPSSRGSRVARSSIRSFEDFCVAIALAPIATTSTVV
jgi:hypothetical protein